MWRFAFLFLFVCFSAYGVDVCFITTKTSVAKDFAKLTHLLDEKEISWALYAGDEAEETLKKEKIPHQKLSVWTNKKKIASLKEDQLKAIAKILSKSCKKAKIIVTEVNSALMIPLHEELSLVSRAKRSLYLEDRDIKEPSPILNELLKISPQALLSFNRALPFFQDQLLALSEIPANDLVLNHSVKNKICQNNI